MLALILSLMPLDKPGPLSWPPPPSSLESPAPPVPHDFKLSAEEWAARCPARVSGVELKARGFKLLPVRQIQPRYPPDMRERERAGSVDLAIRVDTAGVVVDVQLVRASDPAFVNATAGAIWQWRYKPLVLDGKPTCVDEDVGVSFKLW